MELNIYQDGAVVKTYRTEEFLLTTGVCEDAMKMLEADKFVSMDSDKGVTEVVKTVIHAFYDFYPLCARIFPGLTKEEYQNTIPREVGAVMLGVVQYTMTELMSIGGNSKNAQTKRFTNPSSRWRWRSATASHRSILF